MSGDHTFERFRRLVAVNGKFRVAEIDLDVDDIAQQMASRAASSPQQKASAMFGAVRLKLLPKTETIKP